MTRPAQIWGNCESKVFVRGDNLDRLIFDNHCSTCAHCGCCLTYWEKRSLARAELTPPRVSPVRCVCYTFVPDNNTRHRNPEECGSLLRQCQNTQKKSSQNQNAELSTQVRERRMNDHRASAADNLRKNSRSCVGSEKFFFTVVSYEKYNLHLFHCVQPTKTITFLKFVQVKLIALTAWWFDAEECHWYNLNVSGGAACVRKVVDEYSKMYRAQVGSLRNSWRNYEGLWYLVLNLDEERPVSQVTLDPF